MSLPSSANRPEDGPVQKQQTDVYTVMLILAFCALFIGTILLWLEGSSYGNWPWWDTSRMTAQ